MSYPDIATADLTLVIDIGKSHAKLLWVDDQGTVVEKQSHDNHSVMSSMGYPALDIEGLTHWMRESLVNSVATRRCGRVITSTHGAAFVALGDHGLAWAPLDYEFDGFATASSELANTYLHERDDFAVTLSPDLPAGLNAARQLYWLQHAHPDTWAKTRCLLPYPQYWAWWLSGVASSEVSSLGCHTQLWSVQRQQFSRLAQFQGWADLFAPLKPAWQVLGCVRPELADSIGLPRDCAVHVGVHDSNACLARYLQPVSGAAQESASGTVQNLTLVSSGTWTVVMAPAAPVGSLQAERDMLGNVSVLGQPTPTARFMGGREFSVLLDGAAADLGSGHNLSQLVATQTMALPAFASQGGPFMMHEGYVMRGGRRCERQELAAAERSALAALYCAQMTAWLVECLRPEAPTEWASVDRVLVVEGPLATNRLYMGTLQSLLGHYACFASVDELEGTARGAWMLTRWGESHDASAAAGGVTMPSFLRAAEPMQIAGLREYHQHWTEKVATLVPSITSP